MVDDASVRFSAATVAQLAPERLVHPRATHPLPPAASHSQVLQSLTTLLLSQQGLGTDNSPPSVDLLLPPPRVLQSLATLLPS